MAYYLLTLSLGLLFAAIVITLVDKVTNPYIIPYLLISLVSFVGAIAYKYIVG